MKTRILIAAMLTFCIGASAQEFKIDTSGYFRNCGVDVMAFNDFYPEGHQSGVSLIMNGQRVATNGDIRLEATPGQWQPLPKKLERKMEGNSITTTLCYPDSSKQMTGFNPMIYPDLFLKYHVKVEGIGDHIEITVDLDSPVPEEFLGKVGFNLEFYPGSLFGKPWIMDDKAGIYPPQPDSPLETVRSNSEHNWDYYDKTKPVADRQMLTRGNYSPFIADDIIAKPYAVGHKFTSRPDDPYSKVTIESLTSELKLYDGRMNHNNGWFVLRSEIQPGATKGAVKWIITPSIVKNWMYKPVVQTSQVGYMPGQDKVAVIELDARDTQRHDVKVVKIDAEGEKIVETVTPEPWGKFLRYSYLRAEFSNIKEPGLYRVDYGESSSPIFGIDSEIYDRGVWQPVIEYFLPVQMCHMRVNEKYRVWHDACHMDDAAMAPVMNHIDGYVQEAGLSKYSENEHVPDVNIGGWHDAGDFDLRVESQAGESYILTLAYEAFHPDIDVTSIDQNKHVTEIHQSDGRNDILQQIENGALSVVAGYKALGRLYRGIICRDTRQYVMLGEASSMTDGKADNDDDRWIFTENNPSRELNTAAELAAISRSMSGFNDTLSSQCLQIAKTLFENTNADNLRSAPAKFHAAVELYLTTKESTYLNYILKNSSVISEGRSYGLWYTSRLKPVLKDSKDKNVKAFLQTLRNSMVKYNEEISARISETPYGVPYRPDIWGAGWNIQEYGVEQYFLARNYPDIFSNAPVYNALNFILGCHPGTNQASFASGVGAKSATVAYGFNRADWTYIPGGVVSGTAIIRPDFPELLEFPFLWQQTEYVLGGGSSNFMFLVLATKQLLSE